VNLINKKSEETSLCLDFFCNFFYQDKKLILDSSRKKRKGKKKMLLDTFAKVSNKKYS